MNRGKIKFIVAVLCGAGILTLFVAATPDGFRMGRGMEILVNMFRELTLYYVDETDSDKLLKDAATGMTQSLDPYTEYFSEADMEEFSTLTTGRYGGIGSLIRQKGDGIVFAEPYEGSPADKAGIVIGDRILEIDGQSTTGMSISDVSSRLKGDPGTILKVKVEKLHTKREELVKIRREIINVPGVPFYAMMTDSIGYILHSDFTEDCSNSMRNAVMELKKQGAKGLILDYRGNSGGIMQEAVKILSFFLPKGTEVLIMKGRTEQTTATYQTQNEPIDTEIPLAVIVNGGTASASEIVAGALQDLDRAVLVGNRSFGKGLVQTTRPLGYNAYLKLTTAKYYLPSGRCVQAIDYAQRDESGNIQHIPDSLINEFKTQGGRKVYDGGGVVPDILIAPEYVSRFAYILYTRGYISDFADDYFIRNKEANIKAGDFKLSDNDYESFMAFMSDKDIEWESNTKKSLQLLRQQAERERYIESVEEHIKAMEALIKDDKNANLKLYKQELTDYLESEIMLRKGYSRLSTEHNIKKDKSISLTIDIINDSKRYNDLLTSTKSED